MNQVDGKCNAPAVRPKKAMALFTLVGSFDPALQGAVESWSHALMKAGYDGCQPKRRLKVIINPSGGPGKALSIFETKVKPIFEAANCFLDTMVTEHAKHCYEHTKSMQLNYDAIVVLSGDGLVHEVFNAFSDRENAMDAFEIPVVQIPTGSANGLCLALLGSEDGLDICAAALNVIKGRPMKVDLCSVQQSGKKIISFMSQAIGMMADVDLGTENLRWMGESRFMLGFLREVGINRGCRMKLEIKVAAQDKRKMVQTYLSSRSTVEVTARSEATPVSSQSLQPMLPLEYTDDEEWTVIDKTIGYVFAGKLPYVSRDLMQFPLAVCDDGFIDVVVQERVSRMTWLKGMSGAAEGKQFWVPSQNYFKAKAYRLTPYAADGHLSLDGEKYPYAPFEVHIQPRLGTTLGHGYWYPEFSHGV